MFGVAAAAGVGAAAAALAAVSADFVSVFAQPTNRNTAAIPAAEAAVSLLETRLMENGVLI
jgi:hypothetical protein